jgi:hydrogenase maturation protease
LKITSWARVTPSKKTLVLGFGNPDRQDDGVAWHVLEALADLLGLPKPATIGEDFANGEDSVELLFTLQLTPELAETLARFNRACFVDAHTGEVPNDIQFKSIQAEFQTSPFTHHLTPSTLLAMAKALYGKELQAVLVSIRGYEFGFSQSLSKQTCTLVPQAAACIQDWLSGTDFSHP